MKYCKKCILSDNFFSVKIEENGLCNYCNENSANSTKVLDMGIKPSGREYDVVLAYSGGKDSTYTLYLLRKKYKVNVLAIVFDNGFLSEETYSNIKNVCANLDVDYEIISPSKKKLNSIFKYALHDDTLPLKSLERASSICTYCISLVKMAVYREAILKKIPYIAFGWTPGQINLGKQIVKLGPSIIKANFSMIRKNIIEKFGDDYKSIVLADDVVDNNLESIPSLFYPFIDEKYSEEKIINIISKIGWKRPTETDSNSTNCLLNTYAIFKHKEKYGFHPYALELATMVRNGLMKREEAMKRIMQDEDPEIVCWVEKILENEYTEYR